MPSAQQRHAAVSWSTTQWSRRRRRQPPNLQHDKTKQWSVQCCVNWLIMNSTVYREHGFKHLAQVPFSKALDSYRGLPETTLCTLTVRVMCEVSGWALPNHILWMGCAHQRFHSDQPLIKAWHSENIYQCQTHTLLDENKYQILKDTPPSWYSMGQHKQCESK